jgi:hypothetical protein
MTCLGGRDQPGQKVSKTPISINKLGEVVHACGRVRRITVQSSLGKKGRPYLQNNQRRKGVP